MRPLNFETHPDRYSHWKLSVDGDVATLAMDVDENRPAGEGYTLKLNSYDIGVDIELADALQRLRFEHPEVRVMVVKSLKDRMFCAGANIFMLGKSDHGFKVNFCKFTNETRIAIEDLSENSGIPSVCAVNGICAGGGYELALACDEIFLVDDGSSAVSLPEVPLLAVLPGTGGLTRVVDKRRVRRDRADFFCTVAEGIKGKRAVEWKLVDGIAPRSKFDAMVEERARELAAASTRPAGLKGIVLEPLAPEVSDTRIAYGHVTVDIDNGARTAAITLRGPDDDQPADPEAIVAAGSAHWMLAAFRELDDALLRLRFNRSEIGTLLLRTRGDAARVLAVDAALDAHRDHWFVREILLFVKRTLKRLDLTARTTYALVEPGSCFAGTLLEIALAADRIYMLDNAAAEGPDAENFLWVSPLNGGTYPMSNGLTRLETRFLGDPAHVRSILEAEGGRFDPQEALDRGLATFAPDDIDWEEEVRIAIEERVSLSPDALTGMEANLRFPGPETMETKIFGRLTAWQNWIFQRPNAVGDEGALKLYGQAGQRPQFDWRRT